MSDKKKTAEERVREACREHRWLNAQEMFITTFGRIAEEHAAATVERLHEQLNIEIERTLHPADGIARTITVTKSPDGSVRWVMEWMMEEGSDG